MIYKGRPSGGADLAVNRQDLKIRWEGLPNTLNIPIEAVFAVYDPDNFDESFFGSDQPPPRTIKIEGSEEPKKPTLTVVK